MIAPAGFRIRAAHDDDAAALTAVRHAAHQQTYAPLYGQAWVDQLHQDPQADAREDRGFVEDPEARVVVAERVDGAGDAVPDSIVGFGIAAMGPQPWERLYIEDPQPCWQLVSLYALEAVHGTGLGQALMKATVGDADPVYLWIVEGNSRAQAFYEKHGFRALDELHPSSGPWEGRACFRMLRGHARLG